MRSAAGDGSTPPSSFASAFRGPRAALCALLWALTSGLGPGFTSAEGFGPDNLRANDCSFVKEDHFEKSSANCSEKGRMRPPAPRSLMQIIVPPRGVKTMDPDPGQRPP